MLILSTYNAIIDSSQKSIFIQTNFPRYLKDAFRKILFSLTSMSLVDVKIRLKSLIHNDGSLKSYRHRPKMVRESFTLGKNRKSKPLTNTKCRVLR